MGEKEKQQTEEQANEASALNGGLACEYLRIDESCSYSDAGCKAWANWSAMEIAQDKPIESFCKLPKAERDGFIE